MTRRLAPFVLALATAATADARAACPERAADAALPRRDTAAAWLARLAAPDATLASAATLAAHDERLRRDAEGRPRLGDLGRVAGRDEVVRALDDRLRSFRVALERGVYATARATAVSELRAEAAAALDAGRALRVAVGPVALHCLPFAEPVRAPAEPRFDRNRCGEAGAQDAVEVLGRFGRGLRVARTRFGLGFIADDAPLSPPVPAALEDAWRRGEGVVLQRPSKLGGSALPAGTILKSAGGGAVWLAKARGFVRSRPLRPEEAVPTRRPLTRRAFLTEALRHLGTRYGWGEEGGGRDCSRIVLDVMATFGVAMPRTSASQSAAGLDTVEVPPDADEARRLALLDEAHARGAVLVHFPGHIMLYLGRDRDGVPRALHALADYAAPCPGGGETILEVGRVVVTDLALGGGTSRRSFLERMTRLAVFGRRPAPAISMPLSIP